MTQENGKNGHIFEFGKFVLDPNERTFYADGEPVHLTDKVFETLHLLVLNNGRLLTKEQMMTSLWEESFVEEGNLAKNISRLRKILNVDNVSLIETVPRRGYRFAADMKELDGETSLLVRRNLRVKITQTSDEDLIETKTHEAIGEQIRSLPAARSRPYLSIAVVATLLLTVASALGFYFLRSSRPAIQQQAGVLQLTNDPADEFWPKWTQDGRIRFYRMGSDKKGQNMLMNADGTDKTEVGIGHWSPDGTKVIRAKPGDKSAMYLTNADGSNEITLPAIGNTDWSADSKKIVYQFGVGENKNSELYIYSLETGETRNITNHPGFDADPSFSPDGSQVVFASTREGNAEIYLMNSDGSNVRRLTNHPSWDNHPVFSPDGTTIAFNADREDENSDVYLMNTDGGDLRRLTDSKFNETVEPGCWSPDGTKIAFYSDREGNDDIYVTSAEVFRPRLILADKDAALQFPSYSPDLKRVVFESILPDRSGELRVYDVEAGETRVLAKTESSDIQPVISPDGTLVAFQNKVGSNTEICLVDIDGGEPVNLTQNSARDIVPSFSPDGTRLAFVTNREGNTAGFHLYTMDLHGGEQHRVYLKEGLVFSSSWSPDGREIVFVNDNIGSGNFDLYSVSLDDPSEARRLTSGPRVEAYPSVSPDGKRIAFASSNDGNWEIYLVNRDGTGLLRLTRDPANDFTPQFSKDGSRIIFSSDRGGKSAIYEIDLTQPAISPEASS